MVTVQSARPQKPQLTSCGFLFLKNKRKYKGAPDLTNRWQQFSQQDHETATHQLRFFILKK
jgi:hypothetical protein